MSKSLKKASGMIEDLLGATSTVNIPKELSPFEKRTLIDFSALEEKHSDQEMLNEISNKSADMFGGHEFRNRLISSYKRSIPSFEATRLSSLIPPDLKGSLNHVHTLIKKQSAVLEKGLTSVDIGISNALLTYTTMIEMVFHKKVEELSLLIDFYSEKTGVDIEVYVKGLTFYRANQEKTHEIIRLWLNELFGDDKSQQGYSDAKKELMQAIFDAIQNGEDGQGNKAKTQNGEGNGLELGEGEDGGGDKSDEHLQNKEMTTGLNALVDLPPINEELVTDVVGGSGGKLREFTRKTDSFQADKTTHALLKEGEAKIPYDVSTEHDKVIFPRKFTTLKSRVASLKKNFKRVLPNNRLVTQRLRRYLLSTQKREYDYDLEEGHVDSNKFMGMITNPMNANIFKEIRESEFEDTSCTILIDLSGSMLSSDKSIIAGASASSIMTALESCKVKTEVLGFTTKNVGTFSKSFENAYRGCGLRHYVLKNRKDTAHRGRETIIQGMAAVKFNQNADGEALSWAYGRAMRTPESRKIMVVISDGLPAFEIFGGNSRNYGETHLRGVIKEITKRNQVELIAFGLGADVAKFYPKSIRLDGAKFKDLTKTISNGLIQTLKGLDRKRKRLKR